MDLSAGCGAFLPDLAHTRWPVVAADIDPVAVEILKMLHGDDTNVRIMQDNSLVDVSRKK